MKITFVGNDVYNFTEELIYNLKQLNEFEEFNFFIYHKDNKWYKNRAYSYYNLVTANLNFSNNHFIDKIIFLPIKFFKYIMIKKMIKRYLKADIIHIHYLSPTNRFFWKSFKKNSKKIVISIFGSDFYRIDNKKRLKLKKLIKECDALTFTNKFMAIDFINFYNDIEIENKIHIIPFGLKPLDILKDKFITVKQSKTDLDLPDDKIIVVAGYSSHSVHQQETIIELLNKMDYNYKDRIFLILPMTYGDNDYRLKIEKIIKKVNIRYRIIKNFMTYEDVAKLRVATDIMINLPISDQFSGTMQEHLYAGSIVITGSWLPYSIFWEKGAYAEVINDINDLTNKFIYVIKHLDELREKTKINKKIIWELSSWENNVKKWDKFYKNLMQTV